MKTQVKRRSYGQFSNNNAALALVCALGVISCIVSPTMAYAVADPVVESSTVKPDAAGIYDFTNDKNVQNPFPNVITPDEVKELQDKAPTSIGIQDTIEKIFYTPSGKKFSVENGQAFGDTKSIDPSYGTLTGYTGRLGRIDIFKFFPRLDNEKVHTVKAEIWPYNSSREPKNPDGSVSLDILKAPVNGIPYKLEVNGKLIGSNITATKNIIFMSKNQTFIHTVIEGDNDHEAICGDNILRTEYDGKAYVYGCVIFFPECGAQFHFVDDLQYRNAVHIKHAGQLLGRSAGETDRFSTKPFSKLDLSDLSGMKNITGVRFAANKIVQYMDEKAAVYTPLLSYDGDPKKDSVKRPTMEELTSTNIPGYLYYSNDIDTPEGGKFTEENTKNFGNYDYGIVRDKDDNQVNTKHYYVTYRPIPTQLVVQYKNTENKVEGGKPYGIYAGKNPLNVSLTSSEQIVAAPTKPELQKMITDKNTALLPEAAGYLSQGVTYLAPGTYVVKPTAPAPEGYEWVAESADSNTSSTEETVRVSAHKDTDPTQKVVTFVPRMITHTVTFMNDGKQYKQVKVQHGKAIDTDLLKEQSMPAEPTKDGYVFKEWNTDSSGKDKSGAFTGKTMVNQDITVHAVYALKASVLNEAPVLTLRDATITEGDSFNLTSLVVSAHDTEDGDITSKVSISDNGGFDNTKAGIYTVSFTVSDKDGASTTKQARVTVQKKPMPPVSAHQDTRTVPQTGDTSVLPQFSGLISALGVALVSVMGFISHKRRRRQH
ncbi:InlB B-repeat-containing protein [Fannyhessea vaginae]|uniref:InlB B-repeat-containing protein n=1 Tax=Fannyhessea vaginae TaxID=82135 RepID=UPI003A7FC535